MRAQNGNPETMDLRYLCIGNENWGCGGSMSPSQYAQLYRLFSEYCHFPPKEGFYRVACGPSDDNYTGTREFFEEITGRRTHGRNRIGRIEALDMHYYTWAKEYGTATEYTTDEFYGLLSKCLHIEEIMNNHWKIMEEYDPGHSVKLGICEWGTWHHPMPGTRKQFLHQQNSIRDALVAALTLNIFNNNCDKIGMANIAQTVNVLQAMILTKGEKMILTPTYHVFEMFAPHQRADALQCDVKFSHIDFAKKNSEHPPLPNITASCSRKGDILTLSLVNNHASDQVVVAIDFKGFKGTSLKSWRKLNSDDIRAHNTFEKSETVKPTEVKGIGSLMKSFVLPPASVNVLTYTVK
jgi:alpha-N-arabinofuranosidase